MNYKGIYVMKLCAVVFSQNLIIESIDRIRKYLKGCDRAILLTSHQLFDYEIDIISNILRIEVENKAFIDFLSMEELVNCDQEAYKNESKSISIYEDEIKRIKNKHVLENFEKLNKCNTKIILCDDLGIDKSVWQERGYKFIKCKYYYNSDSNTYVGKIKDVVKRLPCVKQYLDKRSKKNLPLDEEIYVSSWNGKKYIFIGKMSRVAYRIGMRFEKSPYEAKRINDGFYYDKSECTYLTSIHESYRVRVPDENKYEVFQIQDGYLPPIYSCCYKFKPNNHKYYAWDSIGERVFKYLDLPVSIMPFRKKIYLSVPKFPNKVKTVLIVTSGAGDWTAMKNRSDEDRMVKAFVDVAKVNPDITFIYRCHPVWVHPTHNGVNSIKRVAEYFTRTELSNIKLSSNIPQVDEHNFTVTYPRSSLEEDLKMADIVFGDHSVSMIDAAIQGTIFASVNVSNRQNLFQSIVELGFPHCENTKDIISFLNEVGNIEFQEKYLEAIKNYNRMTDIEED